MKTVVFLSGLPRTGSTVLGSMLNQHPEIHATTTSPVADLVSAALEYWPQISKAVANPHPAQFGGIISGIINGAWNHIEKSVVVDKNRLWPRFSPLMCTIVGSKPKIICTVRDITAIMASYILLVERNGDKTNFIDSDILEQGLKPNTKNRCELLLKKYIRHPYDSLRIGYRSGAADMLLLEYNDIVNSGQNVVDMVCDFIDCDRFKIDTNNLQKMDENDEFHGIVGLHNVRQVLAKTSPDAEAVLGKQLYEQYTGMKLEFWRDNRKL